MSSRLQASAGERLKPFQPWALEARGWADSRMRRNDKHAPREDLRWELREERTERRWRQPALQELPVGDLIRSRPSASTSSSVAVRQARQTVRVGPIDCVPDLNDLPCSPSGMRRIACPNISPTAAARKLVDHER
jgi:hypothetical protein